MACFLVSAAEAIVVTVAAKIIQGNEKSAASVKLEKKADSELKQDKRLPWSKKLMLLAKMLWGGAFLLCYEHIWHGEVVPWFPFLTAMNDPGDTAEMLHEMSTIGVTMAVIVTVVWALLCVVADIIVKRKANSPLENA